VDKIKSQTAAELAAVQAEQLKKKKEAEEIATRSVDGTTADEEPVTPSFSAEQLAAFDEERKAREKELEEFKELSSKKSLRSLRSRAAAELEEVKQRRRECVDQEESVT
jgi:predicted NodU family carbamoyl transferase